MNRMYIIVVRTNRICRSNRQPCDWADEHIVTNRLPKATKSTCDRGLKAQQLQDGYRAPKTQPNTRCDYCKQSPVRYCHQATIQHMCVRTTDQSRDMSPRVYEQGAYNPTARAVILNRLSLLP